MPDRTSPSEFSYETPTSKARIEREHSDARERNRSRTKAECEINRCRRRPVQGFDVALCSQHRTAISNDMMRNQLLAGCFWPGCRSGSGPGPLRICPVHRAVIVNAHVSDSWVIDRVAELRDHLFPKAERATDGVVYFLRIGGYLKIGWTSDLVKRMRQYPPDTQLLAVKPGTRKDENRLHKKFSHLKTHGREWFPLAPQILEEVSRTVADHGEPPAVDFSARSSAREVGARLKQTRSA